MLQKEIPIFNQTREDPISKNHNLKGNESKFKYFYFKIMNLDKPEQITFIPRNHLHTLMMATTQWQMETK